MRSINGFEIDVFNRFNLDTTKKTSTCPICSKNRKRENQNEKCFAIDWEKGIGTCFNECGSIQLHTFKRKDAEKVYDKPKASHIMNYSESFISYHFNRGITLDTLQKAKVSEGLSYMPKSKCIVSTTQYNYLRLGNLINIKHRGIIQKEFRMETNCELIPYNIDSLEFSKEAIICEGEQDVLSYLQCGFESVTSVPNGANSLEWLDNSWQWFENKEKYFLAIDCDEAGEKLKKELIRRLGAEKCYLIDYSEYYKKDKITKCKDANDVLVSHGTETLKSTIENAKLVPVLNIDTFASCSSELKKFFMSGMPKGYITGLQNLDEVFSTYTKQYMVITGIPTHGKSELVDQMAIGYAFNHGHKGIFASAENSPSTLHQAKIIRKVMGYTPRKGYIEDIENDGYSHAEKFCDEHFYFIERDKLDLDFVLDKVKEMIFRKGIKYFVIDPYNKCRLSEPKSTNINDYTSEYLNKIDSFGKKYDVFGILVAHPNKPSNEEKKGGYKPDFYSIKGGGEFFDMSYHGLMVSRNFEDNYTEVTVMKVKFANLGENNAKVYFAYNGNNGRLTPIENIDDYKQGLEQPKFDNSNWAYIPQTINQETGDIEGINLIDTFENESKELDLTPRKSDELVF